ncbi:MAG: SPOR domain-containing protein [Acidobacteriota bacterium]
MQIAALKDVDQANKVKADLKSKGFPAFVDTVDKAGETFYKVRVGPFSEKGKATEAMDGLKSQGYGQAFVSPN